MAKSATYSKYKSVFFKAFSELRYGTKFLYSVRDLAVLEHLLESNPLCLCYYPLQALYLCHRTVQTVVFGWVPFHLVALEWFLFIWTLKTISTAGFFCHYYLP